jgi:hypothetical protein
MLHHVDGEGSMTVKVLGPFNIDRVFLAIEKQHERLLRAAHALNAAGIPYAVAGDHAVAYWVSRIDAATVRYPARIDIVLRREGLRTANAAMARAGFEDRIADAVHIFVEGPDGRIQDGVRVLFANERVSQMQLLATPDVDAAEPTDEFRVLTVNALAMLLLSSFKVVDSMHLRDMLDVGLIDATWTGRLPPELAARLQLLLDTPDG